jgi:hypothetical protein
VEAARCRFGASASSDVTINRGDGASGSNVELAFDLPSLKVKDAAFGTALHEFAESYVPQYLAYR